MNVAMNQTGDEFMGRGVHRFMTQRLIVILDCIERCALQRGRVRTGPVSWESVCALTFESVHSLCVTSKEDKTRNRNKSHRATNFIIPSYELITILAKTKGNATASGPMYSTLLCKG